MKYFLLMLSLLTSCHTPNSYIKAKYDVNASADLIPVFNLGEVNSDSAMDMVDFLDRNKDAPVVFFDIDSPGGSVGAGFFMIKQMEAFKGDVVCRVDGMAASMAAAILGSCDKRIMTKRSVLMYHAPAGTTKGKSEDMENAANLLKALTKALTEQYCLKSKITAQELLVKIDGKELWVSWEEALQFGFVDEAVARF